MNQPNIQKKDNKYVKSYAWAVSFLSLLVISGCGKQEAPAAAMPAPAVSVFTVSQTEIGKYKEFVARTEASKEANIVARVEGELIEREFNEGAVVKEGQALLKIDPAVYQASLEQSEADLASKKSGLDNAERNLKRANDLINDGYISQSDFDKLTTEASQAKAAVASAEAALEKAHLNLGYTEISAPFSGRIGKVNVDVGNIVSPTSGSLATITLTDPIYVNFQVQESEYITYLQNQSDSHTPSDVPVNLTLRLPNNTTYDKQGKLDFADTKIDQGMGTVGLRAAFENPEGIILPGLFVTLIIESKQTKAMSFVPQAAVQENQQGKFVLVVNEQNQVLQRVVELGRRVNAMWVVETGLAAGEKVIVEGLQKVRPGIEVKPIEKKVDVLTGTISDLNPAPAPIPSAAK